jgi:hypothetical protein
VWETYTLVPFGPRVTARQHTLRRVRFLYRLGDFENGYNVPQTPDLLLPGEVSYIRQHRAILEDIWDAREETEGGTVSSTAPLTMFQLRQQMEVRNRGRKWIIGGALVGSIVAAATGTSLCLWRHR